MIPVGVDDDDDALVPCRVEEAGRALHVGNGSITRLTLALALTEYLSLNLSLSINLSPCLKLQMYLTEPPA